MIVHKGRPRIAAFISIPKNASQSVLSVLDLGPNRNVEDTSSLVIYENHQRAAVLDAKYDLSKVFVFCFSRNPYDRCVSWYQYHLELEPYRSMSFDAWVRAGMPHHWRTQNETNYVEAGLSPLLQYNFVENHKVDFVGTVENYASDMGKIIERLNALCAENGLTHEFAFADVKLNVSDRQCNYENDYSEETRQIVSSKLKKDFEYFGYET